MDIYRLIHYVIKLIGYIIVVIPCSIAVGILWYSLFPLMIVLNFAFSEDFEIFKRNIIEQYVTIPKEVIQEIINEIQIF